MWASARLWGVCGLSNEAASTTIHRSELKSRQTALGAGLDSPMSVMTFRWAGITSSVPAPSSDSLARRYPPHAGQVHGQRTMTRSRGRCSRTVSGAWLRTDLRPGQHRSSPNPTQLSLDQRPGRADEPNHQGSNRQTLPLRNPRAVASSPRRRHRRLKFRTPVKDLAWSHALRIRLQNLDNRASQTQYRSYPSKSGTKHLANFAPASANGNNS